MSKNNNNEVVDVSKRLKRMKNKYKSNVVQKDDDLDYDLGNLAAFDSHPIKDLEMSQGEDKEKLLRKTSRDNAQLLINQIFTLKSSRRELELSQAGGGATAGALVYLPTPVTLVPREKHVPKPKALTKWERYAKIKGIQNKKKSRMIFDEEANEWKPRWGYKRANDEVNTWLIPAKESDVAGEDPFLKRKQAKKERIQKQKKQQLLNIKRANRKNEKLSKLMPTVRQVGVERREIEKSQLDETIIKSRKATASKGKFESLMPNEKLGKRPRQKFKSLNNSNEKETNIKIFNRLVGKNEGDVNVSKAVRDYNRETRGTFVNQTRKSKKNKFK